MRLNEALILAIAALADGARRLERLGLEKDVETTCDAIKTLQATQSANPDTIPNESEEREA